MSKRRPVYLKAVDVFALFLVFFCAASMTSMIFRIDSWVDGAFTVIFALAFDYWFLRLALEVRFLWTGRETRVRNLLKRPVRSAS